MAKPVLVLGGGIAGIQAAIDLGDMGIPVYLVESKPSLGGKMAQLDKTFPTNDCSTCILAPKISECYNHENVTTYTYSELIDVSGETGNFNVKINKKPRYVDEDKCKGCMDCMEKCPIKVKDEYNEGLEERKAIYMYQDQAVPNIATIDPEHCLMINKGVCGLCSKLCEIDAIDYTQKPKEIILNVASVIFAAGYDAFEGNIVSEYGYLRHPNVVTSLEYERLLSASGPTEGHIERPSDNKIAKKIAYLHCAGSRDFRTDKNYCSSVCCMYSMKQSMITKEHIEDVNIDLFYMDIRAFGKDFERYYNRAQATDGINFKRSRVSEVEADKESNLLVKAVNEKGKQSEEKYDLVVLSIGLAPSPQITEMMKKLKIRVNKYGFADVDELDQLATSKNGIFACGVITGPKDIPESVIQASGAAAKAAELALDKPESVEEVAALDERDISEMISQEEEEHYRYTENERIKTGVFVCHCGTNIAGVVDVKEVAEKAKNLPTVEHSEDIKYLCSSDSQELISQRVREKGLNRVLIASCSPRTHLPLFEKAVARGGINPYLTVMVNIRDQDSWVHRENKKAATQKAYDLIRGGVAKAQHAYALDRQKINKTTRAIVVGGGAAGISAALQLANMGFPVSLIEKEDEMGGNANKLMVAMDGRPVSTFIENMKQEVMKHDFINIYQGYVVDKVDGYVGNFELSLKGREGNKGEINITGGIVIVATGARELDTDEYLAKEDERVISQLDLEEQIKKNEFDHKNIKNLHMIQCVGSREEQRPYCSRICCTQAVNNAIHIKERYPDIDITVFYREMRTYGFYEDKYRKARQLGVNFVRFEVEEKPVVALNDDKLSINYNEPITDSKVTENSDMVVLAKAIISREDSDILSKQLKVPINEDGFFLEAHVKLRPVDFATDGIFVCGLAHGPKNLGEAIAQSKAAASRAATVLARDYLLTEPMVAEVNPKLCSGCGTCEDVCAYQAVSVNEETGVAEVNNVLCKGCGNCNSACRAHAINLKGFSHQQLTDQMNALVNDVTIKVETGGIVNE